MRSVTDQDHAVLERWAGMADADTAVVQDAQLGGYPVCLVGIESKSVPRRGFPPTDGPDTYTAGTLFPRSSKKAARAINAASGNRPLVVLANLSGFDGSPDSMRNLQLEYGAEIGRAIVNFDGPDRVLRRLPLPRRRVRGVLEGAEPVDDGARGRGLVRLGASAVPRPPRSCSPARWTPAPRPIRGWRRWPSRSREAIGAERAALATELAEVRTAVRAEKLGEVGDRVRPGAQHPARASRSGRSTRSSRRGNCDQS